MMEWGYVFVLFGLKRSSLDLLLLGQLLVGVPLEFLIRRQRVTRCRRLHDPEPTLGSLAEIGRGRREVAYDR